MTHVTPKDGESIEAMIKRFNKKVANAGIIQEVRNRQAFEKPSDKKRKEFAAAAARYKKARIKMDEQIKFENENKFRPRRPYNPGNRPDNRGPRRDNNSPRPNTRPGPRPEYKKPEVRRAPVAPSPSAASLKSLQEKFNSK